MKLNKSTAVSTTQALLVPYDHRHVLRYHAWMEDPSIQAATASERLTLEEEYENQESWRASHDKLTFIICQPLPAKDTNRGAMSVVAGSADSPDRMVGDVNLFLYPHESDDENDDQVFVVGEVDIMIAGSKDRGKGVGRAVVSAFLHYICRNSDSILEEYNTNSDGGRNKAAPKLKMFMAKIKQDNSKSIALFRSLGFKQEGDVNYFGEVKFVFQDLDRISANVPEGYAEVAYTRPNDER
ncbi:GNAT domain-containing protein [Lasiosphaeris hirsuta]|uniref:GNAT domain-containing protein n=1 Tax=Lasiosphaeris hirsuta TaxID=260670 RepID=A0AA40AQE8_9PEZI|nr:GNAT domain-containing protein [Lasiosphaeris hirsuta]